VERNKNCAIFHANLISISLLNHGFITAGCYTNSIEAYIIAKEATTMKTKNLLIVLALLAAMITGLVLIAQPANDSLAANNPNPGMPGGTGAGAPASGGGNDHIAPGPGVTQNMTPGTNGQLPGDGASGSGAGAGGIAPGPKVTYGADNGSGLGAGSGAAGSGSGDPGLGGPKIVYGADNGSGLGAGSGAAGSGSGDPGLGGPKVFSV
jgi:hypothetical protein